MASNHKFRTHRLRLKVSAKNNDGLYKTKFKNMFSDDALANLKATARSKLAIQLQLSRYRNWPATQASDYAFAIVNILGTVTDKFGNNIGTFGGLDGLDFNNVQVNSPKEFFFEDDINSDGMLDHSLMKKLLKTYTTRAGGDSLYNNGTGYVLFDIVAYPFVTDEQNLNINNVEVIFVNGTRKTLEEKYSPDNVENAELFLNALPTINTKQKVFVFHARNSTPPDRLSSVLSDTTAALMASESHNGRLRSAIDDRRHSKSLTSESPGDRAEKFDPVDSGRKGLVGAIEIQKAEGFPAYGTPKDPGGYSSIILGSSAGGSEMKPTILVHELNHALGDLFDFNNKFLVDPRVGFSTKAEDDLKGYEEWCGFSAPTIPKFGKFHPKPATATTRKSPLAISTVFEMINGSPCPVDVTQVLSYSGHALAMLGFQNNRSLTVGASGDESRAITGTLFEFYMLAATVLMASNGQPTSFFITTSGTYSSALSVAKNSPIYIFMELLNYGEDDLLDNFSALGQSDLDLAILLIQFRVARQEHYELPYSDKIIGLKDIFKLNSFMFNSATSRTDVTDDFGNFTYVNHTNLDFIDKIGFESLDGGDTETIEVTNGQPVKRRKKDSSELTDINKHHRLVISKARGDSVDDLRSKHQENAHDDEIRMLKAIYNGEAIPHQLAFPKEDGSGGEEMKYVYLIVKDKVNLDFKNVQSISDDRGRTLSI